MEFDPTKESAPADGGGAAEQAEVRASLAGDGEAFARLVRRHQDAVAARLWRFTRDRRELDELVQEVFVEAWLGLGGYRGAAPLAHWLQRIATRVGYRFWKRQRRERARQEVPLATGDSLLDDRQAPADPAQAAAELQALLGRLPPRDRLVLLLLHVEERSVAEAAALTGWSRTMVKVQAHRARKKLRALLERRK